MPTAIRYRSKIASIQEHRNFPQAEYALGAKDIDLPVREGFARHTLVGLERLPGEDGAAVPRRAWASAPRIRCW